MKRIISLFATLLFAFASTFAWAVDINTADAASLAAELKGVGQERAKAIVEYREANGPFRSVDDLVKVKGIGPALLEKNRDKLAASQVDE